MLAANSQSKAHDSLEALCNRSIADLRREPSIHSERLSQILLGEQLQLLETDGDWQRVCMKRDGYKGWVQSNCIRVCTNEFAQTYRNRCNVKIQADILPAYSAEGLGRGKIEGKIPFGTSLPVIQNDGRFSLVQLPDDRSWWVETNGLLAEDLWPKLSEKGIAFTLNIIESFSGVPYLWGGRSPFGFDCSGLAAAFWEFMGTILPRNSAQQFKSGTPIEGCFHPGDLLFFGGKANERVEKHPSDPVGPISHVAISLGDQEVIHANGIDWGVSYGSLEPSSKRFNVWLRDHFRGARRYT